MQSKYKVVEIQYPDRFEYEIHCWDEKSQMYAMCVSEGSFKDKGAAIARVKAIIDLEMMNIPITTRIVWPE